MSINMYLGSSDQQAESVSAVLGNRMTAYESIQGALNGFVLASPTLSGLTYNSAKEYSSQLLIPLLKACILLDEAIKTACQKLPSEYRSRVDSVDLKESDLVAKIERADRSIGRYMDLITIEQHKDKPNYPHISRLREAESQCRDLKMKLEEKLQKLREYNSASPQLFSKIDDLYQLVQQGLSQARTSWQAGDQSFHLPNRQELAWVKVVDEKWEQSSLGIQQLIDKAESGVNLSTKEMNALGQYLVEHPNSRLYDRGKLAFLKHLDMKISGADEPLSVLKDALATTSEELLVDLIDQIDDSLPSLSHYLRVYVTSDPYFKNTNMTYQFDGSGYSSALSSSLAKSLLKAVTVKGVDIPISATPDMVGNPMSVKVTGLSSAFMALDFANNLREENVGRAFMHTATTTVATTAGVQMLGAGISYMASAGTMLPISNAVGAALLTHPVGWAIVAGIGVGIVVNLAYDNNVLGIKDIANEMGDNLNKEIENIGRAIQSSWESIETVFGW